MKQLDSKSLKRNITATINANNTDKLQEIFVNVVFNGLVHNNIMSEQMKSLRDSNVHGKLKAGVSKFMPMKWNKDEERYEFNNTKAEKLRAEYGIEFRNTSFDDLSTILPNLFESKENAPKEFNLTEYVANIQKKLIKEGVKDADLICSTLLMQATDNSLVSVVSQALIDNTNKRIEENNQPKSIGQEMMEQFG